MKVSAAMSLAMFMLLAGCSVAPEQPKRPGTAELKKAALKSLDAIDKADRPTVGQLNDLYLNLSYLRGQVIGTATKQQLDQMDAILNQLKAALQSGNNESSPAAIGPQAAKALSQAAREVINSLKVG